MNPRFPITRRCILTSKPQLRGLGDVVALAAKPFARTIDVMFHTHLENCGGCLDRQEKLNALVPFKSE
jgi:hypothetical protein